MSKSIPLMLFKQLNSQKKTYHFITNCFAVINLQVFFSNNGTYRVLFCFTEKETDKRFSFHLELKKALKYYELS